MAVQEGSFVADVLALLQKPYSLVKAIAHDLHLRSGMVLQLRPGGASKIPLSSRLSDVEL